MPSFKEIEENNPNVQRERRNTPHMLAGCLSPIICLVSLGGTAKVVFENLAVDKPGDETALIVAGVCVSVAAGLIAWEAWKSVELT